jgi:glycosyltransferase involved in cell wall biosynthesis
VCRRRPGTTVTLIADGPLAGYATDRLHGNVEVLGLQFHDDMPALLRRHRVTLGQFNLGILSQYELEAMACGVPVVADVRFEDAYTSLPPVARATSVHEAAEALERLLDNPELLAGEAIKSRQWVVEQHSADRVARLISDVYADARRSVRIVDR